MYLHRPQPGDPELRDGQLVARVDAVPLVEPEASIETQSDSGLMKGPCPAGQ